MKTSRPTPRKLRPSARADEPISDREHAFVDGVRMCLPCNPKEIGIGFSTGADFRRGNFAPSAMRTGRLCIRTDYAYREAVAGIVSLVIGRSHTDNCRVRAPGAPRAP